MSDIRNKINTEIKEAMKSKDIAKRDALRLLSSAFKQIEVDERKELTDTDIIAIIGKKVKQGQDSLSQYKEAGRDDLAEIEERELSYFMEYMPKQLSESELESAVSAIIAEVGAQSMKDMGKVMGVASKKLTGTADGKAINVMVKKLLS
jgi:uncharacterized protein